MHCVNYVYIIRHIVCVHACAYTYECICGMHVICSYVAMSVYVYNVYAMCALVCMVESRSDDPDNLGHLVHILMGQVGLLIHKLDVTRISHVL